MALTEEQEALMLRAEMDRQRVTDPQLRAGIAAIAMGESAFQMKPEMGYGGTANERIRLIFGRRLNSFSDDQLDALKANPEAFFNVVYGGQLGVKELGNTEPCDGFKFRGRGLFQLTGRSNYVRYGRLIGRDLVTDPEVADDPEIACAIAVAYMRDRYKGGGWSSMKTAVGFNTSDIEAAKNALFARYSDSGEFGPLSADVSPPSVAPVVEPGVPAAISAAPIVRSAMDRVKAIQLILQEGNLYAGQIDGIWGNATDRALNELVDTVDDEG